MFDRIFFVDTAENEPPKVSRKYGVPHRVRPDPCVYFQSWSFLGDSAPATVFFSLLQGFRIGSERSSREVRVAAAALRDPRFAPRGPRAELIVLLRPRPGDFVYEAAMAPTSAS